MAFVNENECYIDCMADESNTTTSNGRMVMRRFNFYLREELFERIKLLAKTYNVSITKMMVELLERGYLDMLDTRREK